MQFNEDIRLVRVQCPACGDHKKIEIPASIVESNDAGISTIAITLDCGHDAILSIDKKFKVRSRQAASIIRQESMAKTDEHIENLAKGEKTGEKQGDDKHSFKNIDISIFAINEQYELRLQKLEGIRFNLRLENLHGKISESQLDEREKEIDQVEEKLKKKYDELLDVASRRKKRGGLGGNY
ncbi:MAG: hypothetical protein ACTSUE_02170 [Promethearchaeota archaeon]